MQIGVNVAIGKDKGTLGGGSAPAPRGDALGIPCVEFPFWEVGRPVVVEVGGLALLVVVFLGTEEEFGSPLVERGDVQGKN